MKNLLLGILIGLMLVSCDREDNVSRFYWNQTKCADPWNTGENDTDQRTREAVFSFLENEGVSVIEVDYDNKSPLDSLCESCACGTGLRVIVDVTEDDEDIMEDLGFYR